MSTDALQGMVREEFAPTGHIRSDAGAGMGPSVEQFEMSDSEINEEVALAAWMRSLRRRQRKAAFRAEHAAEQRDRRVERLIDNAERADRRWHQHARAAQRRATSPYALLAAVHRRAQWSSRALIAVTFVGMAWSGVNVAHTLQPDGVPGALLWWLSFGIEAMISVPIVVIMVHATTAAACGVSVEPSRIAAFEVGLLIVTVGLNSGAHVAAGDFGRAVEYAVAPVMVAVVIWLHAWVAAGYSRMISVLALPSDAVPQIDLSPCGRIADKVQPGEYADVAQEVVLRGWSRKPVEQVIAIQRLADTGLTPNAIGAELGLPRSTVDRILGVVDRVRAARQAS